MLLLPFQEAIEKRNHTAVKITDGVRLELKWWRDKHSLAEDSPMGEPSWTVITTNASLLGWEHTLYAIKALMFYTERTKDFRR